MVYDRGWIFQELEGPTDGLARIWASICADRRHTDIEILRNGPTDERRFQDWDLKLSVHGAQAGLGLLGMADEPTETIDRLCQGASPEDLPGLSLSTAFEKRMPLVIASDTLLVSRAALSELIATVIVPRLCAAQAVATAQSPSLPARLASLLIAVDATSAFALVEAALYRYVSLGSLATDLLEPAARDLGDLWKSDDCSEIEVTLGLMRLAAIAREFGLGATRLTTLNQPVVLIAPQPGEGHMLGAALDAEMLWQAGWSPRVDFPSSNLDLDSLVASTWFDALDLSLSTSFQRDHRLAQVGKTIASARLASLNPDVVVVVSGRVFSDPAKASESAATGSRIGADGTFGSAAQAQSAILQALRLSAGAKRFG
jgi:Sensors of blue-light using FAD